MLGSIIERVVIVAILDYRKGVDYLPTSDACNLVKLSAMSIQSSMFIYNSGATYTSCYKQYYKLKIQDTPFAA